DNESRLKPVTDPESLLKPEPTVEPPSLELLRKSQTFVATVGSFASSGQTTYQWTTTKGVIAQGQGTSVMTLDTSMLPIGEKLVVTLRVGGLEGYCVNKLSLDVVVGELCRAQTKVD